MKEVIYAPGKNYDHIKAAVDRVCEAYTRIFPGESVDVQFMTFMFQGSFIQVFAAEDDQGVTQELAFARVTRLWHEQGRRIISVVKWSGQNALNAAYHWTLAMSHATPGIETWFEYLDHVTDTERVFKRERIDGCC